MLFQEVEFRPERPEPPGETFEDFYRSRAPNLRRYAVAVAGRESADDACQEAWLRIWRAWGSAEAGRVDAWARQIVRNCCLTGRRVNGPTPPMSVMAQPVAEPDEVVVDRAEAEHLARCIERLPGHLRETLWLREVMGQSYADIAATLGIPIGTVMSRLHTARRKLARRLGREAGT
jgi:RNA polymerase sigma-70 factor (ECF subfamily)